MFRLGLCLTKIQIKKLLENINLFCSFLNDWDKKKDYYINEFLPQIVNYNFSGLSIEARTIFLKIRDETNAEQWKNIIEIITDVKENYDTIIQNLNKRENASKVALFINNLKNTYAFEGFIHSTSFENFINIMKSGYIYSRNKLLKNKASFSDIALNSVIENTLPIVQDYVRFYWRPKTPTNYTNEGIKPVAALNGNYKAHSPNPVILIFNASIIESDGIKFTNRNAGKYNTHLFDDINNLFNFDSIFNNEDIRNYDDNLKTKIKQARCAELLYPDQISINLIDKIIFRSSCDYQRAIQILGENSKFKVDKTYFYNHWLYVDNYNLSTKNNNFRLVIKYNFGECYKNSFNLQQYGHILKKFDKNNNLLKELQLNEFIKKSNQEQTFTFKKDGQAEYISYYIDNIECIRIKIND